MKNNPQSIFNIFFLEVFLLYFFQKKDFFLCLLTIYNKIEKQEIMSYLGDIRENSIGPNGELWEGDNRIEERHYWNGAFIDLCNLSAEDYAKTIFMTNGGGSSDTPTTKPTNTITIHRSQDVNNDGMLVYTYKASSNRPVVSDYEIKLTVQDRSVNTETITEDITLTILNGESLSEIVFTNIIAGEGMLEPEITKSNYKMEDDDFKYTIIFPEVTPVKPMAYHITLKAGELDDITEDELRNRLIASGELDMKNEEESEVFEVQYTPVEVEGCSSIATVEDLDNLRMQHVQDVVIVTDKEIISIEQAGVPINEIDLWNQKDTNIIINGIHFTIWYKKGDKPTDAYLVDPINGIEILPEKVEYIIYYK